MIAVDTNILVYAHRADSVWHSKADQAVAALAEGASLWAIPWPCLHEFVAIVTHSRIYKPPTPIHDALIQVKYWLESPTLALLTKVKASMEYGPRFYANRPLPVAPYMTLA